MASKISEVELSMSDWSVEELTAFFCCVRSKESVPVPETREDLAVCSQTELFWAYNSKTTAQAKQTAAKARLAIYDLLPERIKVTTVQLNFRTGDLTH